MTYKESFADSTGIHKPLELRFHRESRMRYRAESVEALFENDYELLKEYLNHHITVQRPRVRELLDYAEGNNHTISIADRRREKDMADNRAVHNYGKLISSFKQGYLVGNPIKVEYDGEEQNGDVLDRLSRENNFHQLNRSLVLDLSKTGRAYDLVYRAQDDTTRAVRLDPLETFVIFDMTIEEHSLLAVRYYDKSQFGEDERIVEVYTADRIYMFEYKKDLKLIDEAPHSFGLVPVTEYLNTSSGLGDYETELSLIDLYDAAQSDTSNYMQDLSDAILAIIGRINFPDYVDSAEKAIDFMSKMRKARLMNLEPPLDSQGNEGSIDAKYLYKQYDVNGTEAYKNRVVDDIHRFTNTPNMTDEKFSGTQSGEAMKWKVFGLDQARIDMQALFEQSLKRRYRLIANISQILKEIKDFDISKLRITFTPNLPADSSNIVDYVKNLYGVVSDQTVFEILETVTGVDAQEEMDRLKETAEAEEPEPRFDIDPPEIEGEADDTDTP